MMTFFISLGSGFTINVFGFGFFETCMFFWGVGWLNFSVNYTGGVVCRLHYY